MAYKLNQRKNYPTLVIYSTDNSFGFGYRKNNDPISDQFFIPLFSKIVIKVGKPVQPPQSSSRDDLNSVTMHLKDRINNLIG